MNQRLSTNLLIGVAFGLSVAVALVLALPGASSATALAQISVQPTPTYTSTPMPTFTPVPPTPTPTPTNSPLTVSDMTTDPPQPLVMPGEPIRFTAVFTDPPPFPPSYTAVWGWGDGSSSSCGSGSNPDDVSNSETCTITKQPETPEYAEYLVEASHTYTDPGVFNVELTVTRSDGSSGTSNIEVVVFSDETDPPTCQIDFLGTNSEGQEQFTYTVQDTGSGLRVISVTEAINVFLEPGPNADGQITDFEPGTTEPVIVTETQIDTSQPGISALEVADRAGNVTDCDPVVQLVVRDKGKPVSVTLENIPAAVHYVTVYNGESGLKDLDIVVNGHKFVVAGLGDNQEETIDVASAMVDGADNIIALTAQGKPDSSATVVIAN